ncbi:MAG: hypothetical protein QNI99_10645 [Woeseiaceae bacterium]|nr:hypothetical protein [Woeseiaceae bacterium]
MNFVSTRLHGLAGLNVRVRNAALTALALLLSACGGSSGSGPVAGPDPVACDPADPSTFGECGTVYVGLTDADGDFLNYTVDVVQLTLETANGRIVETLPQSTRINFTDYVDVTELVTAATVPPATYVSGTITLDYSDAEVFVESGGAAKEAVVTDIDGSPLTRTELNIVLSDRDRLIVTRGRPALLQLDFDLAASHLVDIAPTPATAASEQFIIAEVSPVDEKDIRVRGPLVSVNEAESNYVIAVRPFLDRAGDFGRLTVNTTDDTEFEVNGEAFMGADGLRALAAAGTGTPTVAAGTLSTGDRSFTADIVLAGSSVPGSDRDAVVGNVIARDGNFLTVRGATIVPSDRRAHFHDDVVVEIGPDTKVFKDGDRGTALSIDAISVGQRVTIRGNQGGAPTTDANAPQILFDATEGAVRMHVTRLSGIVNTVVPGQTDITLHAIDRRRAQVFDFTGTGIDPANDADPANYEIATGNLSLAAFAEGKPVVAYGFPNAFGAAPPDFSGRTVIDFTDVRAALGVGWGSEGTLMPFSNIAEDGLLLNNQNPDVDQRRFIKQGPVVIDLTALDSDTLIVPSDTGRTVFYIRSRDSLRIYTDFADFTADLADSLDGSTVAARSMHAHGQYDAASNVFTARKAGVFLLEL